jgi:hypothetical protein
MTTTTGTLPATTAPAVPRRRTLVLLSTVFLVALVAILATGTDNEADSSLSAIKASYDQSAALTTVTSYGAMAACAVLVFLGVGLRTALRSRGAVWTADVASLGVAVIALTFASWAVTGLALWHAVDQGEDASVRTLNFVDTAGFLPLMLGMACAMIGAGAAGLSSRTLPRWLAIASVVLGCLAPLGPLGFVPALLLPVWLVAVAATVRLAP